MKVKHLLWRATKPVGIKKYDRDAEMKRDRREMIKRHAQLRKHNKKLRSQKRGEP
jgi:hypothetical protein